MAQLICHHLSVGYDSKAVLTDLNFEVNEQDYLCIVGENGAGKSTLMKTILGLWEMGWRKMRSDIFRSKRQVRRISRHP